MPPVAVRVVVVDVAAMVEVTTDDWDVVKRALFVGTKVAWYGWSPLTRSDTVTEAVPEETAWVPTRTAPSWNCTLPTGLPEAETLAVRVAERPLTTEPSVVVVSAAGG